MKKKDQKIIVASSKQWHKPIFSKNFKNLDFDWINVSSPKELNLFLNKNTKIRYIFFLHWNWKVELDIINEYECICFHMTDLPYGRGGSPLQNLILKKKKNTMLSAFKMTKEIDGGPIYIKKPFSLDGRAEEIFNRVGKLSWSMINFIIKNNPVAKPQRNKPTYFKRRKPHQSRIPLIGELEDLFDFIRMLDAPDYPLAFINHGKFKFEFSHSKLKGDKLESKVIIKKRDK